MWFTIVVLIVILYASCVSTSDWMLSNDTGLINYTTSTTPTINYTRSNSVNIKLTKFLLSKRVKKTRPVFHPRETLTVHVLASLYQIVDVDQRSNLVGISAFFDMWWMDKFLTWHPKDYDNVTQTYLPARDVWTPDLYLYHSVQGSTALLPEQSAIIVNYDGKVRIFIPFTAKALCTINVKYFPFDDQNCSFVFGSWSYQENDVKYEVLSSIVDLNDFYDNQEWQMLEANINNSRSVYQYGFVNETYSTMTMSIRIYRESFYYIFNLVIPSTLVTIVAIIGFHVPANSTEMRESKFRLGIMTLLSMGVLLLNVVDDMPKFGMVSVPGRRGSFSDVPLLGIYYLTLIFIVSLGTCSSSVFVKLETYALRNPYDVPCWLSWLQFEVRWPKFHKLSLGETTKMNGARKESVQTLSMDLSANHLTDLSSQFEHLCLTGMVPNIFDRRRSRNRKSSPSPERLENLNKNFGRLIEICCDVLREISYIRISIDKKTGDKVYTRISPLTPEWIIIIARVELISLIIYSTCIIIALTMFYCKSWY